MVALFRNAVSMSVAFVSSGRFVPSRSSCRMIKMLSSTTSVLDDADKRIQFPRHKYGYRTEPFSWGEVQKIVKEGDLASFSRSVQEQERYELYKRTIAQQWQSLVDHILVEKFPTVFEKRLHPDNDQTYVAHPSLETVLRQGRTESTLVRNDFPYHVADGIQHWVFWKLGGGPCTKSDIKAAQERLVQEESVNMDGSCVHWINPVPLKSIPEIDHVHFLILRQ